MDSGFGPSGRAQDRAGGDGGSRLTESTAGLAVKRLRRLRRFARQRQSRQLRPRWTWWRRDVAASLAIVAGLALVSMVLPSREAPPSPILGKDARVYALASSFDELRPPLSPAAEAVLPMPWAYAVEEGDTLLSIAYRFGSSVDAIRLASNIDNVHVLQIGQVLLIPPAGSMLQSVDPALSSWEIAESYGVQPEVVVAYNGLRTENPNESTGRNVILVPPQPVAEEPVAASEAEVSAPVTVYTIVEGDTILGIAEAFGIDPEVLVAANQLASSHWIIAGEALEVPLWMRPARAEEQTAPAEAQVAGAEPTEVEVQQASARPQAPVIHQVTPGDTVSGLAEKFGVDAETIVATNRLSNADRISVGDELTILPISGMLYTVQPGDTLSGIAAAFKVDLGPIIDFNYLENADFISVGMELIIPGARPLPPALARTYVVAPGDTVLGIAKRFGVEAEDIVAANGLRNPDRIAVGDELRIMAGAAGRSGAGPQQAVTRNLRVPGPGAAPPARPSAPGATGNLVSVALQYNGSRYIWGGTTPAGFDCSGFVYYVYQKSGRTVSRGLWGQYNAGPKVARGDLQPGDIVFFQNTYMAGLSHNGIYIGGGQFIHASDPGSGVKISSLSESYWASRWFGATRAP